MPNGFIMRNELKDAVFMDVARLISQLGTCPRKAVGAVLVKHGRCVSCGFNGAPPGMPHCEENGHGWLHDQATVPFIPEEEKLKHRSEPVFSPTAYGWEKAAEVAAMEFGCKNATHAEANALAFAAHQGISTDGCTLFVTVSPCDVCARLLIAAGITRVVYAEKYRDEAGLALLHDAGVKVG